jgi:hypothetical protein
MTDETVRYVKMYACFVGGSLLGSSAAAATAVAGSPWVLAKGLSVSWLQGALFVIAFLGMLVGSEVGSRVSGLKLPGPPVKRVTFRAVCLAVYAGILVVLLRSIKDGSAAFWIGMFGMVAIAVALDLVGRRVGVVRPELRAAQQRDAADGPRSR